MNRRDSQWRIMNASDNHKKDPFDIYLEKVVLSGLMHEGKHQNQLEPILNKELFYDGRHQVIVLVIKALIKNHEECSVVSVAKELNKKSFIEHAGGLTHLAEISQLASSADNIFYHLKILRQYQIKRLLINTFSKIKKVANDSHGDALEVLNYAVEQMKIVSLSSSGQQSQKVGDLMHEAIKQIEKNGEKGEGVTGVKTSFPKLEEITSGWQASDLIILAARPGMGKTAFVLSMARNAALDHNQGVGIFSLEMSSVQLVTRLMLGETGFSSKKLKEGRLEPYEWEILNHKVKKLSEAPIFIDDSPGLTPMELQAKADRMKKRHNIKLLIIDYLQLMTSDIKMNNSVQEVSLISRSLKLIAKELNIPVIALSQLSRAVDTASDKHREGKRPIISDLRGSGSIEQDADMVIFVYRPEYYNLTEDEDGNNTKGLAEIIIAKHRNGSLGKVRMQFIPEQIKFKPLNTNPLLPEEIMYKS